MSKLMPPLPKFLRPGPQPDTDHGQNGAEAPARGKPSRADEAR